MSMHRVRLAAVVAAALALAACQKAAEKSIEKSMEAEMKKSGATDAKVDLSGGTFKATTVDASGKTQTMEVGGAQVTEADIGIPFYPGATVMRQGATKMVAGEETNAMVPMETSDAPDKVIAFYRDKLKAMSTGKQFVDMAQGEGNHMLMLGGDDGGIQVSIAAGKDGAPSTVTVASHRRKKG
jgi:hypothetical protein